MHVGRGRVSICCVRSRGRRAAAPASTHSRKRRQTDEIELSAVTLSAFNCSASRVALIASRSGTRGGGSPTKRRPLRQLPLGLQPDLARDPPAIVPYCES